MWDVNVGVDPAATVDATAAGVMLTLLSDPPSFMLNMTAKPDALSEPTEVRAGGWTLVVDQGARLVPTGTNPLASFTSNVRSFAPSTATLCESAWTARTPASACSASTPRGLPQRQRGRLLLSSTKNRLPITRSDDYDTAADRAKSEPVGLWKSC